jgi:hypothetical protein
MLGISSIVQKRFKLDSKQIEIFNEFVKKFGIEAVLIKLEELTRSSENDEYTLTIVTNIGLHPLPEKFLVGEVFFASEGQMDFSNVQTVENQYKEILLRAAKKLKEKNWKKVFVLPFGHVTLAMQIKLLVQKVLSIESTEIIHLGNGEYSFLSIDQRALISDQAKITNRRF